MNKANKLYNFSIENWWLHNGIFDREQASGLRYCGNVGDFLQATDNWWESLSYEERKNIYDDFFAEY